MDNAPVQEEPRDIDAEKAYRGIRSRVSGEQ